MSELNAGVLPDVGSQTMPAPNVTLDATGVYYRELNRHLRELVLQGTEEITLHGVYGQRYLGTNLQRAVRISVHGVPGNDLGAFMDGPQIEVMGSAQDGCGNTMNSGALVIHGSAGDIVGHSMRGGEIMVRDNVGYRVGIHMKEYEAVRPVIVIGGTAQHFLGEYMSGGVLIVLGSQLGPEDRHPSRYVGTGMHGGVIYMRGQVHTDFLGQEVGVVPVEAQDEWLLRRYVARFVDYFGGDVEQLMQVPFTKLIPKTKRPYGRLYAY
ncbi:MAG: GltB/FmdC/FwdC-like GXGXG domain-containing protein [Anaerolineae bacterium]